MPLTLAPGESIGHEASGRKLSVWLTNRRLVAEQSGLGKTALTSLPLEKMDHVLYAYTSQLRWLVIGVILSIVGLSVSVAQDDNRGAWAIAGGGYLCDYLLPNAQETCSVCNTGEQD